MTMTCEEMFGGQETFNKEPHWRGPRANTFFVSVKSISPKLVGDDSRDSERSQRTDFVDPHRLPL